MAQITIDKEGYEQLNKKYHDALDEGNDVLKFRGHELLTSYAKYLLEYIEMKNPSFKNNNTEVISCDH